jgi:hypothetical protein
MALPVTGSPTAQGDCCDADARDARGRRLHQPVCHSPAATVPELIEAVAGLNLPGRMMAVANQQAMAILIAMMAVSLDVFFDLPLDRRLQSPAGTISQNVINRWLRCQMKLKCVTVHKAYPFSPAWDAGEQLITIHRRYAAFIQLPVIHDFQL